MRRNLVVAAVLAALIAVVQLILRAPPGVVVASAVLAFALTLGILWVADRFGRRD